MAIVTFLIIGWILSWFKFNKLLSVTQKTKLKWNGRIILQYRLTIGP
ncbi:hypothetical protein [Oceanobacillus sp. CF4.6]